MSSNNVYPPRVKDFYKTFSKITKKSLTFLWLDVMIDDDYKIIQQLSNAKIKTLYFRDTNLKKLDETDYVHEVNNWGDIYRYFSEL